MTKVNYKKLIYSGSFNNRHLYRTANTNIEILFHGQILIKKPLLNIYNGLLNVIYPYNTLGILISLIGFPKYLWLNLISSGKGNCSSYKCEKHIFPKCYKRETWSVGIGQKKSRMSMCL